MGGEESPSLRCPKCGSGNVVGYQDVWECMDCGYKFRPKLESISRRHVVQERTLPTIQKSRSLKRIFALVLAFITVFSFGLILGYGAGLSNAYTKTITITKTIMSSYTTPQTIIASRSPTPATQQVSDAVMLHNIEVHVKPSMIDSIRIYYSVKIHNCLDRKLEYLAILKVGDKELRCSCIADPNKDDECSVPDYQGIVIDRPINVREFDGKLLLVNLTNHEQVFLEKVLKLKVPTVKFGEIIPPEKLSPLYSEYEDIQIKLVSWFEGKKACEGPFFGGDYLAFNASKGMKFIILKLNFTNIGKRIKSTPYISEGEIATNTGNIYPLWHYPSGWKGREASQDELEKICPVYEKEKLLQGESSIEYIMFEIRENEKPVEALLPDIPYLIVFQD